MGHQYETTQTIPDQVRFILLFQRLLFGAVTPMPMPMPMRLYVYMPLYASGCVYAPAWLAGWLAVWWALSPPSHLIQCSIQCSRRCSIRDCP
jgi:hypothetical protein